MVIVKSIETKDIKVWIEQHNDYFILKHQEKYKDIQALTAMQNLTLVFSFFDTLVGKKLISN